MAYIGKEPTSAAFLTDQFSGNGSTVAFTMSVVPANTASVIVTVSGVVQDPTTYSVNATTLTFSTAPPIGTGNISVRYLGVPASNVTTAAYRTVTEFTATAGQTVFAVPSYTLGYIDVYRNGVRLGTADFVATSGTSVILVNAATAGDLVATESFYVSSVLNAIPAQAGQVVSTYLAAGAASQEFLDIGTGTGTGALKLPVGTTAQRPTGAAGLIRQNSTTGNPEWWDATTLTWLQFSQPAGYLINFLVVAGGGGGGSTIAGGGGAGGLITESATLSSGTAYTITVGAGGAGDASGISYTGSFNGSNSLISTIATAIGGGGGGSYSGTGQGLPKAGGSGGGSAGGQTASAGVGTTGQGNAGGLSNNNTNGGGGGGGASAVGAAGSSSAGGSGGAGITSSISGTALSYAGGGGGGGRSGTASAGSGGTGGGGAGRANAVGTAGTTNSGGGGGGGGFDGTYYNGGNGGSGIVIIAYLGSQRGQGGTVTSLGGFTIHTFTSSGTYNA